VWQWNSGYFVVEITVNGVRRWLGTFSSPELVVRAYDFGAWMFDRSCPEMNFPEVESLRAVEFRSQQMCIVTRKQKKGNCRTFLQVRAHEADVEAAAA
jgi:hypothetical protein